jgi:hypothetical protein
VIVSLTGYFFGRDAGNTQVGGQIAATFGKDTADQFQKMIEQASET